jgi:hypothetical protein
MTSSNSPVDTRAPSVAALFFDRVTASPDKEGFCYLHVFGKSGFPQMCCVSVGHRLMLSRSRRPRAARSRMLSSGGIGPSPARRLGEVAAWWIPM